MGINALPSLTELTLQGSAVSDAQVRSFAKAAPNLTTLTGDCTMGDDALAALARHCKGLTSLDIWGTDCTGSGMRVLKDLALKRLEVDHLDLCDDDLRFFAASFPQLEFICLSWSGSFTVAGLQEFIAACPVLRGVTDSPDGVFFNHLVNRPDENGDEATEAEKQLRKRAADECVAILNSRRQV